MCPRLYSDLSWIWPYLSPPENYAEEAEVYFGRFRRLGVPDGGTLLHLGSGGGSLDSHLKANYRIIGIDLSPAMIEIARQVNPEVEYVQGDMRTARLGQEFDAVLLHDAAAYMTSLDDLKRCHETAAAHLVSGGALLTPPEELRSRFKQNRVHHRTIEKDGVSVTTVEVTHDPDPSDSTFELTFVYLIRRGGSLEIETDTHVLGVFELEDILDAIRSSGFESVAAESVPLSTLPSDWPWVVVTALRAS